MRKQLSVPLIATRRPIKEVTIGKTEWQMKRATSVGKINEQDKNQIKICVCVS